MGLAARPGRSVPAVHHAHETPADRRIPGWRTGPERWGRQSRPFTSPPPAAPPAPGRAPGSSRTATSRPWSMASGRRSRTRRPGRRTIRASSSRRRSPTSSATRSRRRTHGRTCSSGGASWPIGKPALPASARGVPAPTGRIERGASLRARGYRARAMLSLRGDDPRAVGRDPRRR